jgi:predicted transcriptional regulator of viral defense system
MTYLAFRSKMKHFPVFTTEDIRALDARFDFRRLYEWQQRGHIRKIVRGCYLFSDVEVDEALVMRIANRVYRPSYISLETALSHYHLIPEHVYAMTSASVRRTYEFATPWGRLSYRTINRRLFFGYTVTSDRVRIAMPEKALLDYLYLNPSLASADDFASRRIDRNVVQEQVDEARLRSYLVRFSQKRLTDRARRFMEWVRHA